MKSNVFHGVGGVCILDPSSFNISIPPSEILKLLDREGFKFHSADIVKAARSRIDRSAYDRDARQVSAPNIFNCRTYAVWNYAQVGVRLSGLSLKAFGNGEPVHPNHILAGDLVFVSDKKSRSGRHVGMATSDCTVIHAQAGVNVQEIDISDFIRNEQLRHIVRIIDNLSSCLRVECPASSEVTCSSDFEPFIRRTLSR